MGDTSYGGGSEHVVSTSEGNITGAAPLANDNGVRMP